MIYLLKKADKTLNDYIENKELKNYLNYLESYGAPALINEIFNEILSKKIKTKEMIKEKDGVEYCYISFRTDEEKQGKIYFQQADFEVEEDIEYLIEGYCITKDDKIVFNAFEIQHDKGKMDKNMVFEFELIKS